MELPPPHTVRCHSSLSGTAATLVAATAILAVTGMSISEPDLVRPITGFVYDGAYLAHETGMLHPERPDRLRALTEHLEETGMWASLKHLVPSPASLEWVTKIHTAEYVEEARRACQQGRGILHSADTAICPKSYDVALLAAGGVLNAIDAVVAGEVRNAFCAVRPPGHHALPAKAMGFCLFNNVAIGARYAQKKHGLKKVLIVDWDVHHGNGTQAIFYDDPTVLYFSTHQYPLYPGTGAAEQRGADEGAGFTVNVPLPAGSTDEDFLKAFREALAPKALEFRPDIVLISAGFDAHADDPLGGMRVTTDGFAQMTALVREIADTYCKGRLVSVLEGGYDLDALAQSVAAHLEVLQTP